MTVLLTQNNDDNDLVDDVNTFGSSALHYACANKQKPAVKTLLDFNADKYIKNKVMIMLL